MRTTQLFANGAPALTSLAPGVVSVESLARAHAKRIAGGADTVRRPVTREVAEMWPRAEAIVAALKLLYVPARALLDEASRIAGG